MSTQPEAGDRRYKKLLENINDSVTVVDALGAPLWTTASIRRDLGYEAEFWDDADLFSLLHPDDEAPIRATLTALLGDPSVTVSGEVRLRTPGGEFTPVGYTAVNLLDDPDVGGIVLTSRSIAAEVENRRLQAAREDELVRLADAQSDLIASISHEMRNPLHAITGLSELLLTESSLSESAMRSVQSLSRESSALRRIIDDLLDFSKAAAGRMELDNKAFSPAVVADESITTSRVAAETKGLSILATIDPAVPLAVLGDAFRTRQVLLNLLSNAVKYTDAGSVTLEVLHVAGDAIRFGVRDTGPGIPADAIETIFDPYQQARRTDSKKGTGLGLAITKELVELMGGTLELATSPAGTHFWCDIPFAPARRSTDRIETAPATGIGIVLVVDDSEVNRMLSSSQLERLGYTPITAHGGTEALEVLKARAIDLVLMDWHMPDKDGLQTTKELRERESEEGLDRTPVIAVTASAVSGDRERCLAAGMDDYLSKPVSIADLAAMVSHWIGSPDAPERQDSGRPQPGIDASRIDELIAELGDQQVVASVVATFLTELPKWKTTLVDGVATDDFDAARRSAHTLKSTAALLGAHDLAATCEDFENAATNDEAKAASMVDRFVQQADSTATELSNIHEQLQRAA